MAFSRLLVLGCGYVGTAVARAGRARGLGVTVTLRDEASAAPLRALGLTVLVAAELDAGIREHANADTHVVVAFPPDGRTDARVASALAGAGSIVYVSSTGVYGDRRGVIDDTTPIPAPVGERARRLLDAEELYRGAGATILRCPGIYGPERGLHRRILGGEHRIPGDGSRTLSRIHVADLAELLLAAAATRGEIFVVGDLEPAPHGDVVRFVCETYGVPLPPSVPLGDVHDSLRADRHVDASRALGRLGVKLRFPSYRAGMSREATGTAEPAASES
jgi:nucleoside-diphosphate-sugar epimerase